LPNRNISIPIKNSLRNWGWYKVICDSGKSAQLHSRYNPQAEAARYIDALGLKGDAECFILIEPGLGYIIPVLEEKFPNSKIVALHIDKAFAETRVPTWRGTDAISAQDFLEREIPETDASRIRIIEWRPSLNLYGKEYFKLLSQAAEFIKRAEAGRRTRAVFGKKWIRNFFKNLGNLEQTLLYREMETPVIITGSGPGLETALPLIRQARESCLVLAAASSVMALGQGGVRADIVIATDGGSWALQHVYPYFRNEKRGIGFAVDLFACLPSQCGNIPQLILNDGSLWRSLILHGLGLPSVIVPQKGTVAAAAVELALLLSTGNIYLAGMDLSVKDCRSHARPYGFDHLLWGKATRLAPYYSNSFTRSSQIREGGSYGIYAAWFKNRLAAWPKRIFSLGAGHEVFETRLPQRLFDKKTINNCFKTVLVSGDSASIRKRGVETLLKAIEDPRYSAKIKAELKPLFFPDEDEVSSRELVSRLKQISLVWCKKHISKYAHTKTQRHGGFI
jgi:hypothetical protein